MPEGLHEDHSVAVVLTFECMLMTWCTHLQILLLLLEEPFLLPGHFPQQPSALPASVPALLLLLLLLLHLLMLQLPHPLYLPLHVQHSFLGLLQG